VERDYANRPPPAEHLSRQMRAKRTSVKRLARYADVTETHIQIMRNTARHWYQVEYLLEVLDRIGYPPGVFSTRPDRVRTQIEVSDTLYERMHAASGDASVNQLVIETLEKR